MLNFAPDGKGIPVLYFSGIGLDLGLGLGSRVRLGIGLNDGLVFKPTISTLRRNLPCDL